MAKNLFTGRSGQLAVMAEFLIRELNVAIPEVDIGDDIVVVRADNDEIPRVQVKTANAKDRQQPDKFYAPFKLPLSQLETGPQHLVYAFVVRRGSRWEEFVMVRRSVLEQLWTRHDVGSEGQHGNLLLGLTFTTDNVTNKDLSFQPFRNRFLPWPPSDEIPDGVVPSAT